MGTFQRAEALDILRHPQTGRVYVAADSLVDVFTGMANSITDQTSVPARNLHLLAEMFSGIGTGRPDVPADGSKMHAVRCLTCDAPTIHAVDVARNPLIIDAEPVPDGAWFPMTNTGVPRLAPYGPHLDGHPGTDVRLQVHTCPPATAPASD